MSTRWIRFVPWPFALTFAGLLGMLALTFRLGLATVSAGDEAPDILGTKWLHREPTTLRGLRGSAVLLEFFGAG